MFTALLMFNFAPAKSDSLISAFLRNLCLFWIFVIFTTMGANFFHRVESLSFMVLCVYENLELFLFVSTGAVLITEAANCKAINHVCMDNNSRESTPETGALRRSRNPLYTFVFIILWVALS